MALGYMSITLALEGDVRIGERVDSGNDSGLVSGDPCRLKDTMPRQS
jgi:hypothetical protein